VLFAGDLVVNGGTVLIPASHGGSVAQYLASLRRVLELQPRRILPGHGGPIDQPAALLRGYIAHRLSRERQIVDLLRERPMTVDALVGRIYPDLAANIRGAAAESVLAHVLKLQEEGRAAVEGGEWRLTTE
jgi:hydroxyacylglutathione hydrolase